MFRKCHHSARCNRSRGRSLKKQRKATDIDHVGDSQTTATTAMHWRYPRSTNSGVCEGFFRGPFIKMNRFLYISLLVGGGCPRCKKNIKNAKATYKMASVTNSVVTLFTQQLLFYSCARSVGVLTQGPCWSHSRTACCTHGGGVYVEFSHPLLS